MCKANQRGDILIALIIAIILAAVLGSGIYSLTTTSSFSEILYSNNDNAFELAKAGIRMGRLTGITGTFNMPDANHTFTIAIAGNVVTSTGTVNTGLWQSTRLLTYTVSAGPGGGSGGSSGGGGGNFMPSGGGGGGGGFPHTNTGTSGGGSGTGAITVNSNNGTINLGGGLNDSYGSIWYNGAGTNNNCYGGACILGSGLNAYFEFSNSTEDYSTNSTNSADGFTFAVMSALTNTSDRTGGAPAGYSSGEMMGYSGPGNTTDGLGLKPPKMAIEFDTYPNATVNTTPGICGNGSRNDANAGTASFMDHAALIFWGSSSPSATSEPTGDWAPSGSTCPTTNFTCTINGVSGQACPDASFDDNVHGAGGTGTDPLNSSRPASPNPGSGYYEGPKQTCKSSANTCNWLKDGYTYSARVEIVRPGTSSGSDVNGTYYYYTVNVWILSWNPTCSTANTCFNNASGLTPPQQLDFMDLIVPYTDTSGQISVSNVSTFKIKIYQTDHNNLSNIFFGFTEATGAATQQITLGNINAFFPSGSCPASGYSISPGTSSPASAGGNYNVTVGASSGCPWVATTNVTWITFGSGGSGSGNSTVSYNVSANSCPAARIGYIHIPGHYSTVTQAAGAQIANYSIVNNTNATIYRQAGGNCTIANSIPFPGSYSIAYNAAATTFYAGRNAFNNCTGNHISITGAQAVAADTNCDGNVQINSSWALADY